MQWPGGGGEEVHTQISLDLARDTPTPELTAWMGMALYIAVQWDTPTPELTLHCNDPLYKRGHPTLCPLWAGHYSGWDCSEFNGTTPSLAHCLQFTATWVVITKDIQMKLTTKPLPPLCCTLDW